MVLKILETFSKRAAFVDPGEVADNRQHASTEVGRVRRETIRHFAFPTIRSR